ncbi:MAG: hypothetical protein OEY56_03935 [Cyclobacteriaceae bacterium]|nr:hypothetical protein [Cyclobacteriaceae bacterium]
MYRKAPTLFFLLLCSAAFAQQSPAVVLNSNQPVNPARYNGILRTPYLLTDFSQAKLLDPRAKSEISVPLNYNGYTNQFEIQKGDSILEINKQYYVKITFESGEFNPHLPAGFIRFPVVFSWALHPQQPEAHFIELFEGEELIIFKKLVVTAFKNSITQGKVSNEPNSFYLQQRNAEDVNKQNIFSFEFLYYVSINGVPSPFHLYKKEVLQAFGNNKSLKNFVKEKELKLTTEDDLILLARYYDELNGH